MRVMVIGFGSMGQRHARILSSMGLDVAVVSRRAVEGFKAFSSIPEGLSQWRPEYVAAAERTAERISNFAILANAGFKGKLLLEKPPFHKRAEIPNHSFAAVFVAYNLRFHPVIRRLKEIAMSSAVFAVHAYVGQHLSLWRPDADYRQGYSARRAEGGGVLRDLSHELDYLNWMLGGWTRLTAAGGCLGDLGIDSDDVFSVLFETRNCPVVSAHMNYLDTIPRREITLLTSQGTVRADLVAGTAQVAGNCELLKTGIDETVIAEHKAVLEDDRSVICSFEEGMNTVAMIEAAEKSALDKTWRFN